MKTLLILAQAFLVSQFSVAADNTQAFKVITGDAHTIQGDVVKTNDKGIKFEVTKTHTVIEVAPHSEVKLALQASPESIELISGMSRAHVEKKIALQDSKPKFILKSKAATMGVRGTDFVAIATPILGESEIIVFEGNVDFASTTDADDVKHVPAGHWGGIGGRFGAKNHELIALPKATLNYFNQASTIQ